VIGGMTMFDALQINSFLSDAVVIVIDVLSCQWHGMALAWGRAQGAKMYLFSCDAKSESIMGWKARPAIAIVRLCQPSNTYYCIAVPSIQVKLVTVWWPRHDTHTYLQHSDLSSPLTSDL